MRWWRGREREDGSESGSDASEKDSGWEREGVEERGERRRVWWSRAAEERERKRVKKKRWGVFFSSILFGRWGSGEMREKKWERE